MLDGYKYSDEGKCDLCGKCVSEVLVLRAKRFTKRAKKDWKDNVRRVCWSCGIRLNYRGEYDFGTFWRDILINFKFNIHKKRGNR